MLDTKITLTTAIVKQVGACWLGKGVVAPENVSCAYCSPNFQTSNIQAPGSQQKAVLQGRRAACLGTSERSKCGLGFS